MTDKQLFKRLCDLLPAQFEAVLMWADVPVEYVSTAPAPQATRARELLRWGRLLPANAERLRSAASIVISDASVLGTTGARKVLFLSAEPTEGDRLQVNRELERLRDRLCVEIAHGRVVLESRGSVRLSNFSRVLLEARANIVHFSGHGAPDGRLILETDGGEGVAVDKDAVGALFAHLPDVECVVLNACYTETQAGSLAEQVPHVIGMRSEISDDAALVFATGFYGALATGRDVPAAFALGCVELRLLGIPEHLAPVLRGRDGASPNARRSPPITAGRTIAEGIGR